MFYLLLGEFSILKADSNAKDRMNENRKKKKAHSIDNEPKLQHENI